MSEVRALSREPDLADGDITEEPGLNERVGFGLTHLARDVELVRKLHVRAAWFAVVPVVVLLGLLLTVILAYSSHIEGANEFLKNAVKAKPAIVQAASDGKSDPSHDKVTTTSDGGVNKVKGKEPDAKSKDEDGAKPTSDQAHLYTMISSYQATLTTSAVAVISILVVAIVVITVAVLRSTLAVEPYDPSKKFDSEVKGSSAGSSDQGYAVPILEFVKNTMEVAISTFKGKKD